MNDWEKYMTDFIGDEMLSIDVPANKVEIFYEEITEATTIRGAYFVAYQSSEAIHF